MAAYYPRKMATYQDLVKAYGENFETWNEPEEERLEMLKMYGMIDILYTGEVLTDSQYQSKRKGRAEEEEDGSG